MSILTQFFPAIPLAEGDNRVLQAAYLHHLFPENFSFAAVQELRKQFDHDSFKLLAADAWMLLQQDAEAQARFRIGWTKLMDRPEPPLELPYHHAALLGLALASRAATNPAEHKAWWQDMLVRVRTGHRHMAELLEVVLGWTPPAPPAHALEVYAIAAALFCAPPVWEAATLASFLQGQRKCSYPYAPDDFFEDTLRIYVSDFALALCLRYEQELLPGLQHQLKTSLLRLATRRATWQVGLATLAVLIWMATSCYLLFAHGADALASQARWDELSWVFLWVSGPFGAALSLLRIVFFWVKGRNLDFDLAKMRDRYALYLQRRWEKHLKLS